MDPRISNRFNELKGREAWLNNIQAAYALHNRVKSTLGPKGAYKMVTYNRGPEQVVKIAKDVVPVLDELGFQYPSARILCEAAKMQREEDGDGVTQFAMLATALLIEADKLMAMGIHPNTIAEGYEDATRKAVELAKNMADSEGVVTPEEVIEAVDCGRGLLTRDLGGVIIEASRIAIRDGRVDDSHLGIVKKVGGSVGETQLIRGVVVKGYKVHDLMPDHLENPRIALLSGKLGVTRVAVKMKGEGPTEIECTIKAPSQMKGYRDAERKIVLDAIDQLKKLNINVVISGQVIEDSVKSELAKSGIYALEKVSPQDLVNVSKATNAKIVSGVGNITESDLGSSETLETDWLPPDRVTILRGCDSATFLLRGSTSQATDEAEALIRTAVNAVRVYGSDRRSVPGGGAAEMRIASELRRYALSFSGRRQVVIEHYADAMSTIPKTLAENMGYEPIDIMTQLSKLHVEDSSYGIGLNGCSQSICRELLKSKVDLYRRACDIAAMMLRIGELWVSKESVKFHKKQ